MRQDEQEQDPTGATRAAADRYSAVAILLHWMIAILLVAGSVLGWRMERLRGPDQFAVFQLHKSIGITVLLLTLLRLGWRMYRKPPPLLVEGWEGRLAALVHGLFYVALIGLPLSGWLMVSTSPTGIPTLLYGFLPWPHVPGSAGLAANGRVAMHGISEQVHHLLGWLTYALILLHVAGAMKHHFRDTAPSLARMIPGTRAGRFDPRLTMVAAVLAVAALSAAVFRAAGGADQALVRAPPIAPSPIPATTRPPAGPAVSPKAPLTEPAAAKIASAPASGQAAVARWIVAPGSAITFRTAWGSQPIEGSFRAWTADIRFDPDALERSHVEVTVDTGSALTGDAQRDSALSGEDWFASARFPRATFSAGRFERQGNGRYQAHGILRLRGAANSVILNFSLKITGDRAVMTGRLDLDRTAFTVGRGEFAGTDQIPALVAVEVRVEARRAH